MTDETDKFIRELSTPVNFDQELIDLFTGVVRDAREAKRLRAALLAVRGDLLDWCADNRWCEGWELPTQISDAINRLDEALGKGGE
jgi:hypothetical protein